MQRAHLPTTILIIRSITELDLALKWPEDNQSAVTAINLSNTPVDATRCHTMICKFNSLEVIIADGCQLEDLEFDILCAAPALQSLSVANNRITRLFPLRDHHTIKTLNLTGNPIADNQLEYVTPYMQINLNNTHVTQSGIDRLKALNCTVTSNATSSSESSRLLDEDMEIDETCNQSTSSSNAAANALTSHQPRFFSANATAALPASRPHRNQPNRPRSHLRSTTGPGLTSPDPGDGERAKRMSRTAPEISSANLDDIISSYNKPHNTLGGMSKK